jgi:hypothetical protein
MWSHIKKIVADGVGLKIWEVKDCKIGRTSGKHRTIAQISAYKFKIEANGWGFNQVMQ